MIAPLLGQTDLTGAIGLVDEILSLSFGELVLVALVGILLFGALRLYEAAVRQLLRWRFRVAVRLERWLPPTRLAVVGIGGIAAVSIMLPDEPGARALASGGALVLLFWAGREVLRNAAAGAVIIARQAVHPGDYVQVGPHSGRVRSVTLRGIELEQPDGSHTWVPGVLLHTDVAHIAPGAGRAAPVIVVSQVRAELALDQPEVLVALVRRLAVLSPRRAPGTPVLVSWDGPASQVRVTVTPFEVAESDALRAALHRRVREAEVFLTKQAQGAAPALAAPAPAAPLAAPSAVE